MTQKQMDAIQALQQRTDLFCSVQDIAPILEADPQDIRDTAARDISQLGFKAIRIGHKLRIPRSEFLMFLGYQFKEGKWNPLP